MEWIGDFVVNKRKPLLVILTIMTLSVISFIPTFNVDDQFIEWFDQRISFRVDTDFATDNLVGPYNLEFSVGMVHQAVYRNRCISSDWRHSLSGCVPSLM